VRPRGRVLTTKRTPTSRQEVICTHISSALAGIVSASSRIATANFVIVKLCHGTKFAMISDVRAAFGSFEISGFDLHPIEARRLIFLRQRMRAQRSGSPSRKSSERCAARWQVIPN